MIERVCVVGGGVIGSLYAAHLARVTDVWMLTRREEHAEALRRHGLHVTGKNDFVATLSAAADPADLPAFDLGILATKATQLAGVAKRLEGRFPESLLMTVQNGLGAEEVVRPHGSWQLVSAVTFMSGTKHSDVHVEYELDTPTWIGPYRGTATPFAAAQEVEALLRDSGLQAEAMADLLPAQWSKLIFNATVNAVCALTGLPHDHHFVETAALADLGSLVRDLIGEGMRVADAAGIPLHEDPWEMNVRAVRRGETESAAYRHLPSMLEDVLVQRPTEIDFITGALVKEALRLGVEVPLHTALYRLVKGKEASWQVSTGHLAKLQPE